MRVDWKWWAAIGIGVGAFLLLHPNPVSPAVTISDPIPELSELSPYAFRPSFCVHPAARHDMRCVSTVGKWM